MPPDASLLRLLDRLRERIRYHYFSLKNETGFCLQNVRINRLSGLRHTAEMDEQEASAYLT
jgi:hypothetical protein